MLEKWRGIAARRGAAIKAPLLLVTMALLVTLLLAEVAQATFPGANGKIAFERGNETAEHDIYAINPDGTGELNLTHNGSNNRQIAWSPDGSQIAFFSDGDGRDNYYDIHVARADGSGSPIRVTTPATPSSRPGRRTAARSRSATNSSTRFTPTGAGCVP